MRKLETAKAAAEEDARRKEGAQQAEEQAARSIADQEQIQIENRRRQEEEYEEQEADRLALEQGEQIYTPGEQIVIAQDPSSPTSSIGTTGFFPQSGSSTQTTYEATGFIDPTSEATILRYLQWQSIMHGMQQPLIL